MKRIIPTHFIVDCPNAGGRFSADARYLNPDNMIGVLCVFKIKEISEPLHSRMVKRGYNRFFPFSDVPWVKTKAVAPDGHLEIVELLK